MRFHARVVSSPAQAMSRPVVICAPFPAPFLHMKTGTISLFLFNFVKSILLFSEIVYFQSILKKQLVITVLTVYIVDMLSNKNAENDDSFGVVVV